MCLSDWPVSSVQAELEQRDMVDEETSDVILVTRVRSNEALETQVVSQAAFLSLGVSRGEFIPCSFSRKLHPLAHGPFLHLQSQQYHIFKSPTLTFLLPLSLTRTLVIPLAHLDNTG